MTAGAPGDAESTSADDAMPPGAKGNAARLAVVGDIHLYRLAVAPWRLLNKRLLGQLNLWLWRRFEFKRELLRPLLRRVVSVKPDLLLLTGDLTTVSLPEEFDDVRAALATLDGTPTLGLAGNHDRYTFGSMRRHTMEQRMAGLLPPAFPHVRALTDRWRLLALDAAVPRPLSARGRIGRQQLAAAAQAVADLSADDGLVVMCHYGVVQPASMRPERWRHRLADADALRDLLRQTPARIVFVHGHIHRPWRVDKPAPGLEHVTDVNAGAPCRANGQYPAGQGFWQIDLPANPRDALRCTHHVPVDGDDQWQSHVVP